MSFDPKPEPFTGKVRVDREALDGLLKDALARGFYFVGIDTRERPQQPPQLVIYFDQQMETDGTPIPSNRD